MSSFIHMFGITCAVSYQLALRNVFVEKGTSWRAEQARYITFFRSIFILMAIQGIGHDEGPLEWSPTLFKFVCHHEMNFESSLHSLEKPKFLIFSKQECEMQQSHLDLHARGQYTTASPLEVLHPLGFLATGSNPCCICGPVTPKPTANFSSAQS